MKLPRNAFHGQGQAELAVDHIHGFLNDGGDADVPADLLRVILLEAEKQVDQHRLCQKRLFFMAETAFCSFGQIVKKPADLIIRC